MLTDSKNRTKHAPIERVISTRASALQEDWSAKPQQESVTPEQHTTTPVSSHSFDSVGVFAQESPSGITLQRDFQEGNVGISLNLGSRIGAQLGAGTPLEASTQAQFGNALHHDFSSVRVHADSEADALSRSVNARAFTTGQDIFFKQGNFNPSSSDGQKLLAHELTHTIQQSRETVSGTPHGDVSISDPTDRFEQEASARAESVTKNENTPVQKARDSSAGVQIQRLTDDETKVNLRSPRLAGNARLQDAFDNNKPVHMGESGDAVVKIQEILIESGIAMPISTASGAPDGIFGQETRQAVIQYQGSHGLGTDGAVGRQTLGAMDAQTGGGPRVTPTVVAPPTPAGGTITGNPTDIAPVVTTNLDGTQTVDERGTTHTAPTLADASNHTAAPAAADGATSSFVDIIRDASSPIESMDAPETAALYREAGSAQTGFSPVSGFHGTMAAPAIEEVANNDLFIEGEPSPGDVEQSGIGDCYFMALMISMAARDPGKIEQIMTPDGSGGATVLMWQRVETPAATPGGAPTVSYQQVAVQVSNQLAYDRSRASALGTATADERRGNGHGGFVVRGAQLRAAPTPLEKAWWAELNADTLEVHRRDVYQIARWAPLLEKAFARQSEVSGQYGGANRADANTSTGNVGYEIIDGGLAFDAMFVFYGPDADPAGPNAGNAHETNTNWTPGSNVVLTNQAAMNDLILLQGRGDHQQPGDTTAPVLTAGTTTSAYMPRLTAAIAAAQADPDWANLAATTQNDCLAVSTAIATWTSATGTARATAQTAVGNACVTAADPTTNADLHDAARSAPLVAMLELLADVRNEGTDNSSGQRNIYGNHEYSVVNVSFKDSAGAEVPLSSTPIANRAPLFATVDALGSIVTLRNPHHTNEPDIHNSGTPADGTDDGVFTMNLDQFFRNFTTVDAALFPVTPRTTP